MAACIFEKNVYMPVHRDVIEKYNQPVPRYTSYPTVPFWKDHIDVSEWKAALFSRAI
jgi:oxygen-independent coproporphyrinogen-3 oxidase